MTNKLFNKLIGESITTTLIATYRFASTGTQFNSFDDYLTEVKRVIEDKDLMNNLKQLIKEENSNVDL